MKRVLLAAGIFGFLFAAQMTVYADSEMNEEAAACITREEACGIALSHIPEGSKFQFAENKGKFYEVVYYNDALQEYYQLNMDSGSGDVRSYKSWLFRHKGSKNVAVSEEEVKELVTAEYPEADNLVVNLDFKGELKSYLVDFTSEGMRGTFEVNPENGQIIGKQVEME
ncbi:PepSY domain-containing protein [Lachnospiraceae bacterium 62-35]